MKTLTITRRTFLGTAAMAAAGHSALAKMPMHSKPRVGCQLNGFNPKMGNFDAIVAEVKQAKEWDYVGFECNVRFVRDQFADPAPARAKLAAVGSFFIAVHTSMNEFEKEDLGKTCDGAHSLGAHYIVMSSGGLSPDGHFTEAALEAKCEQLEKYGRICNAHGMGLAYHNHTHEFANHNAENQGLADHTDPKLVHFLMDAGHAYQGGGDPALFMMKNSSRIVGCHLKTFKNNKIQVPLGQGDWGFEKLAQAVKKTGWAGWLMTEEGGGPQGGDTAAMLPDREYIRKVFGV
jgi:sugar phosphate isomerase/epimerase